MSILLNDGSEFKGGNLEFDFRDTNDIKDNKPLTFLNARKKGTLVVFPSFIWHRVTPVTFGTRYSLVMWSLGKPYR
jgi:PKHD-type hydroxylase